MHAFTVTTVEASKFSEEQPSWFTFEKQCILDDTLYGYSKLHHPEMGMGSCPGSNDTNQNRALANKIHHDAHLEHLE